MEAGAAGDHGGSASGSQGMAGQVSNSVQSNHFLQGRSAHQEFEGSPAGRLNTVNPNMNYKQMAALTASQ